MRVKLKHIFKYSSLSAGGGFETRFVIYIYMLLSLFVCGFSGCYATAAFLLEYTSHIITIYPKGCPLLNIFWVPICPS